MHLGTKYERLTHQAILMEIYSTAVCVCVLGNQPVVIETIEGYTPWLGHIGTMQWVPHGR